MRIGKFKASFLFFLIDSPENSIEEKRKKAAVTSSSVLGSSFLCWGQRNQTLLASDVAKVGAVVSPKRLNVPAAAAPKKSWTPAVTVWAGFTERSRDGNKFVVAERPVKQGRRNYCTETEDSIIEERKARRENAANGFFDKTENGSSSSNLLDALFVDS